AFLSVKICTDATHRRCPPHLRSSEGQHLTTQTTFQTGSHTRYRGTPPKFQGRSDRPLTFGHLLAGGLLAETPAARRQGAIVAIRGDQSAVPGGVVRKTLAELLPDFGVGAGLEVQREGEGES